LTKVGSLFAFGLKDTSEIPRFYLSALFHGLYARCPGKLLNVRPVFAATNKLS